MKINGKRIEGPNEEYIVIPRHYGDIVFKAIAVLSMDEFNVLVPSPKPRMKTLPGGIQIPDTEDKGYADRVSKYGDARVNFIVTRSLRATEGLEWETVKYEDPTTWGNYEIELKESGFTFNEIQYIVSGVFAANALNESKLEAARASFLASLLLQKESQKLSSLTEELPTTPSGEPAKDSAFYPPV